MSKNNLIYVLCEQIFVFLVLLVHLSGFVSWNASSSSKTPIDMTFDVVIKQSPKFTKNIRHSLKTVLVVIDALREDHLTTAKTPLMPYSMHLLENNKAIAYSIKSASPTVTLPRLKSIITGSIPTFLEVVFNFAAREIDVHNIIWAAFVNGLKMEFYGDKVWLDLFPGYFSRSDFVTSFYVSDYTEVDNNVTKHLRKVLPRNDWDFIIFHYLGLDHIGHLAGPKSPLIGAKLKEMDDVIKTIHHNLEDKKDPYLMVVCGDHGMSDVGSHGGDSHAEIWTSSLFVSNIIKNKDFSSSVSRRSMGNQVDLASTLAIFLGVEIPRSNIGLPLLHVLNLLPLDAQLSAHYQISKQLNFLSHTLLDSASLVIAQDVLEEALKSHAAYWTNTRNSSRINVSQVLNLYHKYESFVSTIIVENTDTNNFAVLYGASLILLLVALPTFIWYLFYDRDRLSSLYQVKAMGLLLFSFVALVCFKSFGIYPFDPRYVIFCLLAFVVVYNIFLFVKSFLSELTFKILLPNSISQFLVSSGLIIYPFTLLSTSFIEEEHFFFYFIISLMYFIFTSVLVSKLIETWSDCSTRPRENDISSVEKFVISCETLPHELISNPPLFDLEFKIFNIFNKRQRSNPVGPASIYWRYSSTVFLIILSWTLSRILRSYFPNGDKWKDIPSIIDYFRVLDRSTLLLIVILSLVIFIFLYRSYFIFTMTFSLGILATHYSTVHEGSKKGLKEAQFCYVILFLAIIYYIVRLYLYKSKTKNVLNYGEDKITYMTFAYLLQISELVLVSLYLLLQKPENLLGSTLSLLHFHLVVPIIMRNHSTLNLKRDQMFVLVFWIGQAHFFFMGNSNSFSSIQINSGFVGISSYLPFIHGCLIVWNTFGPKFLVYLHALSIVFRCYGMDSVLQCLKCWWNIQLFTLSFYIFNVTMQRHHLFIWSVFAPKLLYEESHFIVLFICTLYSTFIYFLSR